MIPERRGRLAVAAGLMLIILMLSLSAAALAQSEPGEDQARLLLFSPVVYSPDSERDSLATELSELLSRKLQDRGVTVMTPEESLLPGLSPERKQALAREKGTDYALWGSLTVLGQGFSLDMNLQKTTTEASGRHFFASGDSLDSLSGRVDQLVADMVAGLFRQKKIKEIQVEGNARIEAEAIKRVISTREGDLFDRETLSRDLETIHDMGYFEDIRVTSRQTEEGRIVTFQVRERPTVRKINIKKNLLFEDEEILAELDLKRGSIVNLVEINSSIKNIKRLYTNKNYHNVKVTYELISRENNQADLELTIERGDKFRIRQINFEGNQKYSDKELLKIIKTSEKGFLLWIITSAGDLKEDQLQQDIGRLASHYHNHGYIDARISDPRIVYGEEPDTLADDSETPADKEEEAVPPSSKITNQMISEKEQAHLGKLDEKKERDKGIFITFEIEEGQQYHVDEVNLSGDLIKSRAEMEEQISIAEGSVFNRSQVQQDLVRLDAIYSDQGYYYADIYPETTKDEEDLTIDINYKITKGEPVYFDNIIITGNTKTRDKVIRRQLDVYEQELYSGQRLKKSVSRLYRLNYFENVNVNTVEKPDQNAIDLKIDVTEKPTGEFSFGGGYSSIENAFATASISQNNLFGRGQRISLQAEIGGTTTQYRLSFTEPWLFDIPLSAGIDLYDWEIDYDTYDKKATGGGLRFGYPVFENTRLYLSNTYEVNKITDISGWAPFSIINLEEDLKQKSVLSSVSLSLVYDSRDRAINPSRGFKHVLTTEKAGGLFGGDVEYTKYTAETSWYHPLFWKLIGFVHSEGGYVENNGYLPDYERFYLGGMNSLRGFGWHDISIKKEYAYPEGVFINEEGGNKYVQFNAELRFPLFDENLGLVGLCFYDTGNVYEEGDNIDLSGLRESAGFGVRWYSPMGPIRLERGYILDPREGEDSSGRWEFTMGTAF